MNIYEYMTRFDNGTISARDTLDLFAWIAAKQPLGNLTGPYFARAGELVEAGFITPEGAITQRGLNWAEDRDERDAYERARGD